MNSALVPDRVGLVRALAGDTVLFFWAGHLTLTVPLSTQEYKWVPAGAIIGDGDRKRAPFLVLGLSS